MGTPERYMLAGDIGGTKTILGLYRAGSSPRKPLKQTRYTSQNYASLGGIISEFLSDCARPLYRASFGVAGPVLNEHAHITNLPWVIEERELESQIKAPVYLLNDLTATAYAIPHLESEDFAILNPGKRSSHQTLGVVAPGTGLGEAFLVWTGRRYHPLGSEGGHVDFAPSDSLQMELLEYLQEIYGHVSYERVCSGSGLPNIYAFLKDSGKYHEPAWLKTTISQAADPTPVIVNAAIDGKAKICKAVLDLFASILGNEAGNFALKILATGGMYLAGGIPPRILPWLQKSEFMKAFSQKGRFTEMLQAVPVQVILNSETALIGAACYGLTAIP